MIRILQSSYLRSNRLAAPKSISFSCILGGTRFLFEIFTALQGSRTVNGKPLARSPKCWTSCWRETCAVMMVCYTCSLHQRCIHLRVHPPLMPAFICCSVKSENLWHPRPGLTELRRSGKRVTSNLLKVEIACDQVILHCLYLIPSTEA